MSWLDFIGSSPQGQRLIQHAILPTVAPAVRPPAPAPARRPAPAPAPKPSVLPPPRGATRNAPPTVVVVTGDGGPRLNPPKHVGKFLQNAYASYNAAPDKNPNPVDVPYAMKQFKKTHAWARSSDANQNRELEMAVRYLLMKPKRSKVYYNP